MSQHLATIHWRRGHAAFVDKRYSRAHVWRFDGGAEVLASSSPLVVPQPLSNPAAVDPEEAFVASLSSCHLRWFLDLAARAGLVVERYLDEPDMPDVDLFIRTSGEQRTSNFLPWQSAYAEMVFLPTLWPDVDRTHLWSACETYASRDRRYGGAVPHEFPSDGDA